MLYIGGNLISYFGICKPSHQFVKYIIEFTDLENMLLHVDIEIIFLAVLQTSCVYFCISGAILAAILDFLFPSLKSITNLHNWIPWPFRYKQYVSRCVRKPDIAKFVFFRGHLGFLSLTYLLLGYRKTTFDFIISCKMKMKSEGKFKAHLMYTEHPSATGS